MGTRTDYYLYYYCHCNIIYIHILGCHKLFIETQDEEYHNTRAIYNTRYENAQEVTQ